MCVCFIIGIMIKSMKMKTHKIKCACGHRFKVTKNDAYGVECDFTGPDYFKFKCPKCGRTHYIDSFSV